MPVPDAAPQYAQAPAPGARDSASSISQQLLSDGLRAAAQGINWCESDYAVSPSIAEWWNTLSNIAFLVNPLLFPLTLRSSNRVSPVTTASLDHLFDLTNRRLSA
jgi:hypothetical protein